MRVCKKCISTQPWVFVPSSDSDAHLYFERVALHTRVVLVLRLSGRTPCRSPGLQQIVSWEDANLDARRAAPHTDLLRSLGCLERPYSVSVELDCDLVSEHLKGSHAKVSSRYVRCVEGSGLRLRLYAAGRAGGGAWSEMETMELQYGGCGRLVFDSADSCGQRA